METYKTSIIAAISALVVVVVAWTVAPVNTVVKETFGGSYASQTYIDVGGVVTETRRTDTLNTASTTICSLQAPAATSTLVLGSGVRLDVSSTTNMTVSVYKANLPSTATTLLFSGGAIGANAKATVTATTSTNNFVFSPNQWLNVIGSGGTGTYSPSGTCQAQFVVI